jgi:transcriptional regulator with XRE-family HTH domain
MQALSVIEASLRYDLLMPAGRPPKRPRSQFGQRLAIARQRRGLSQTELANRLGVSQKVITYWERNNVALRTEQISAIAAALDVSTSELIGQAQREKRECGPVGKSRQIFEAVSKLPRKQQEKIFDILQPFLREHLNGHTKAAA